MTENEIIQILKDNKEKGIAFGFLPDEVIQFALKHKENLKFHDDEGFWIDMECQYKEGYEISIHEIVCLTEDFELKKKSEGEWVEFNIKDGVFYDAEMGVCYKWYEWSCFITKNTSYEAFGGWQYKNNKSWFTIPQVEIDDGCLSYNYCLEAKPVIPIKIRFWKSK